MSQTTLLAVSAGWWNGQESKFEQEPGGGRRLWMIHVVWTLYTWTNNLFLIAKPTNILSRLFRWEKRRNDSLSRSRPGPRNDGDPDSSRMFTVCNWRRGGCLARDQKIKQWPVVGSSISHFRVRTLQKRKENSKRFSLQFNTTRDHLIKCIQGQAPQPHPGYGQGRDQTACVLDSVEEREIILLHVYTLQGLLLRMLLRCLLGVSFRTFVCGIYIGMIMTIAFECGREWSSDDTSFLMITGWLIHMKKHQRRKTEALKQLNRQFYELLLSFCADQRHVEVNAQTSIGCSHFEGLGGSGRYEACSWFDIELLCNGVVDLM